MLNTILHYTPFPTPLFSTFFSLSLFFPTFKLTFGMHFIIIELQFLS